MQHEPYPFAELDAIAGRGRTGRWLLTLTAAGLGVPMPGAEGHAPGRDHSHAPPAWQEKGATPELWEARGQAFPARAA